MLVLLTGENGFLGRELKNQLKNKYLLLKKKRGEKYIINLKKLNKIETFLKKYKPDIIINTAVISNFDNIKSSSMMDVNYYAVKKLVDYCHNFNKKLIQISGTIVHPKSKKYHNKSKLYPKNFYGITKLKADNYILRKNINYKIIRFGGIYGSNGPNHLFINRIIKSRSKEINFEGNYLAKRNYIHVKLAAKCIEKLINVKKKGIYYAGGRIETFQSMLKKICKKKKIKLNLKFIKKDIDEIVITNKIFNTNKKF